MKLVYAIVNSRHQISPLERSTPAIAGGRCVIASNTPRPDKSVHPSLEGIKKIFTLFLLLITLATRAQVPEAAIASMLKAATCNSFTAADSVLQKDGYYLKEKTTDYAFDSTTTVNSYYVKNTEGKIDKTFSIKLYATNKSNKPVVAFYAAKYELFETMVAGFKNTGFKLRHKMRRPNGHMYDWTSIYRTKKYPGIELMTFLSLSHFADQMSLTLSSK